MTCPHRVVSCLFYSDSPLLVLPFLLLSPFFFSFFFFHFLFVCYAPETSALFMGSPLQFRLRILCKGCTKSTAVASLGSSVYPSFFVAPVSLPSLSPSPRRPSYILTRWPSVVSFFFAKLKFVVPDVFPRVLRACTLLLGLRSGRNTLSEKMNDFEEDMIWSELPLYMVFRMSTCLFSADQF